MSNSNSISTQTVKKISKSLAKLNSNPDPDFLQKYTDELSSVLNYLAQLAEVDTTNTSSTDIIPTCKISDLRDDEAYTDQAEIQSIRQRIIYNFPKSQSNLLTLNAKVIE